MYYYVISHYTHYSQFVKAIWLIISKDNSIYLKGQISNIDF